MQCRGRRSSRGVGPDTCLVISHAHRIAINEQEKATGAGRRCAGAGTRVAKGSFVEVWEVGERFLLDDGQSFSGAELLRYTRLCHQLVGAHAAREGLALRRRQPAFSVKHLYVSASRATSAELVSVC